MSSRSRRNGGRSLRSLYVWHRWIGIICALLVLWLTTTGILLNHASRLGIDRQYPGSAWLLRLYDIRPEPPAMGFKVEGHWLSQAGDLLFLDDKPVAELRDQLIGGAALPGVILASAQTRTLLLTRTGELIETMGSESLPGAVLGVSGTKQAFLFNTAVGIYAADPDQLIFERYAGAWPAGQVIEAQPLPPEIGQAIVVAGGGIRLNGERVLADLHSGRLFGRYGPWVMDLASLGFMFLALSGLWLWWRYRQSQHDRNRPHQN